MDGGREGEGGLSWAACCAGNGNSVSAWWQQVSSKLATGASPRRCPRLPSPSPTNCYANLSLPLLPALPPRQPASPAVFMHDKFNRAAQGANESSMVVVTKTHVYAVGEDSSEEED